MVAKIKDKASKSKVLAKAKAAAKMAPEKEKFMTTSALACGFRNLMKYRASETCKKALTVWGS